MLYKSYYLHYITSLVSVPLLGRFLASIFSILSCFFAFLFSPAYDDSLKNSFSIPNRFLPLGRFPIIPGRGSKLHYITKSPKLISVEGDGHYCHLGCR